ncbi:MAG: hypothetical protein M3R36_09740 [Bacteroidota bacterium]|nr:hypothetical protein [Bacteroidota bacterium]
MLITRYGAPAIVHATIRTIGLVATVNEEDFLRMTLIWMAANMIINYLVILNYKDFWKM